jgi:DnaJ-class molecular chaperone
MPYYEIRISATSNSIRKSPKPSDFCVWKCPFCHGDGLNPYGISAGERCPACHGHLTWEADTICERLSSCGRCAGTGRINYMGTWAPCTNCKGSGKV